MNLRPYQAELLNKVFYKWRTSGRRVLLQSATGSGKTVMLAAAAKRFLDAGQRVLVVSHTVELVTQAARRTEDLTGHQCGIIKAGFPNEPHKSLQSGSVQSLRGRLDKVGEFDLIIVDECHHTTSTSYVKILNRWPNAFLLGCSATPRRLDKKGFDHLFDCLVTGPSVKQLIKDGYLSPYKLFAGIEMSTAGVRTTAGDFNLTDLAAANDAIVLSGNLLQSYQQHAAGHRCIVFAINVAHSKAIAQAYNEAGITACHLDGTTPAAERAAAIEQFKAGNIQVLTNCGLFSEGVDIPAVGCVQLARPSQSLCWYLQACGRSRRPDPNKSHAIILDHGKNWERHGLPDSARRWSLTAPETNPYVMSVSESGQVSEVAPKKVITENSTQLEEIDEQRLWQVKLTSLIKTCKQRGYKAGWVVYQLKDLRPPLQVWEEAAKHLKYQPGWAWYKYQEALEESAA